MLGYSLEASCQGASNEYPQHMFSWRNKKNIKTSLFKEAHYFHYVSLSVMQDMQILIILHIYTVSSGLLLSIDIFVFKGQLKGVYR